jgi:membrane protein implicated in regulation of membrane protease activity
VAPVIRGCLVVGGFLLMLAGLALVVGISGTGTIAGLQLVAFGALVVIAVAIERNRYRSASAERRNDATGPGGGEPTGAALDPRFRPTAEVFIDPTTNQRMRVVIDPASGERRYVAEG